MEPLKTIDAETLISTPLRPVHFIVDRLIPPGLHLLGGSPKIGKSWLMLWLCLKAAQGEPLWEFHTTKCGVLYLCLEDTFSRIQDRLFQIADEAPANLHFAVIAEQIGSGLREQIEAFIKQHPDTRLVVIDTLQRVRGANLDSNAYANDYRDISVLKQLADERGIAIIIIHHLRKLGGGDPFMRVSGTTGLTGAVDSTFVLERENLAANTAKLYVTGRDVEYQELVLSLENCVWQLVRHETQESIRARETPPFLLGVVDFMKERKTWQGSATELLAALGDNDTPVNSVTKLLNQFHGTYLAEHHVAYSFTRTGKARMISLLCGDGCDGCDSCDGDFPAEKELS